MKRTVALVLGMVAGVIGVAAPAHGASNFGCPYPYVCFYKEVIYYAGPYNTPVVAKYKDVTSYYQKLGASARGSRTVFNSRNDDVAYLKFSNGKGDCVPPNGLALYPYADSWVVTAVRIDSSSVCYPTAICKPGSPC